jgi:hypothetical protein
MLGSGSTRAQDPEEAAVAAAQAWLALVDAGEYGQSWDQAAELFRNAVSREEWERMAGGVRKPFGALVSRELKAAQATTTLPGAPDGEYVVVHFAASFENKQSAFETVTPMKDADGVWRVSGYYIK